MGFFSNNELVKKTKKEIDIDQLNPDCGKCGLYKNCIHPKIKYTGEGKKEILIISDYPGKQEDEFGIHLVGENGDFLKKELKRIKISLHKDCWKIAAVNCSPPLRTIPSHKHLKCCYPMVQQTILKLKPKVIILLGNIAVTSLFGEDFSNRTILRWRAHQIPDEKFKCFILPLFAPYQLIKQAKDKNLQATFRRDLKRINVCLKKSFEESINYEQYVTILQDFKRVKTLLKRILKRKQTISFDYETTGLKPHRNGHKIVTIGVSVSPTKAYAFPFDFKSFWTKKELHEIKSLWHKIIADKDIKKICHNIKFEDSWSAIRIGSRIQKIHWDAMIAQKIIDNRAASTGLKFQTFIRYGVRPYDKTIAPFLKAKGEFNTVEQAPLKDLLIYNGLDCIFTHMLYKDQKSYLEKMKELYSAYRFFLRGIQTMSTIQLNGINVNNEYYEKVGNELTERISKAKKYLTEGREARKFKEQFKRDIKITSNQDLGKLFFEVLGKNPVYTEAGNYKTDSKTLESLNLPFVDKLSSMKRLEKAKGTYLAQFEREVYKGKIHPFFDLHIPVSYRSSSSKPNFQNIPKRNAEIKKLIRMGIVPSKDSVICEADFSGAEVITSVCYHKDKNFYNYLIDPTTDMHRDNATDLLKLPHEMLERKDYSSEQKKLVKMIRFFAKNNWTFAQFYGDWFGSCGPNFWENVVEAGLKLPNGMTCKEWLESQGIFELGEMINYEPTPGSFLEHCKEVELKMWNERFPEYTKWKKDIVEFYQNYGFIETYFGFRFTGYMDSKQCTNFPIQGTSFHLLLFTLIKIEQFLKKNKLKTKIIGQIHDSVILDLHKNEIVFVLTGINKIVSELSRRFKWLIVPMEIEIEMSRLKEKGGTFSEMEEFTFQEVKNGNYLNYINRKEAA
jgi:DNA polymerase-1